LMINGVTANFSFPSGDAVTWTYNLPTGGTATGEIWYDINQNGVIDPAVDIIRYYFTQTDGVGGDGGPPDLDGSVNCQIFFSDPIGVAPGKYVVKFTNNGSSQQVAGTVTPLATVAHRISGHVTPPPGRNPQWVNVEIKRHDNNQPSS